MLETLSSLISLVKELLNVVQRLIPSKETKLARKILQIHLALQTIIDDAFMTFDLVANAEGKIQEFGAKKYSQILKDHFHGQLHRMHELRGILYDPDTSTIIRSLNKKSSRVIMHLLSGKGSALEETLYRIHDASLKFEDGELYAVRGKKKVIAFPNVEKQLQLLQELENTTKGLSEIILRKIQLSDLLRT